MGPGALVTPARRVKAWITWRRISMWHDAADCHSARGNASPSVEDHRSLLWANARVNNFLEGAIETPRI